MYGGWILTYGGSDPSAWLTDPHKSIAKITIKYLVNSIAKYETRNIKKAKSINSLQIIN